MGSIAKRETHNANRRLTMATAVFGGVTRAASRPLLVSANSGAFEGQSPLPKARWSLGVFRRQQPADQLSGALKLEALPFPICVLRSEQLATQRIDPASQFPALEIFSPKLPPQAWKASGNKE